MVVGAAGRAQAAGIQAKQPGTEVQPLKGSCVGEREEWNRNEFKCAFFAVGTCTNAHIQVVRSLKRLENFRTLLWPL